MRQTPTPTRDAKGRFLPRTATGATPTAADAPNAPTVATALYTHTAHPHTPRNVNEQHKAERTGLNQRIAVWLTTHTGSMLCAYIFAGIGVGSLVGVFTNNLFLAALFGSVSSYFLQLVLLPILAVGTAVLSRHSELQANEMFATSQHSFADIEQIAAHLTAQDAKILEIEQINQRQLALLISLQAPAAPKE
jgi:hypothetical protein